MCPDLSSIDLNEVELEQAGAGNVYISLTYMDHERSVSQKDYNIQHRNGEGQAVNRLRCQCLEHVLGQLRS